MIKRVPATYYYYYYYYYYYFFFFFFFFAKTLAAVLIPGSEGGTCRVFLPVAALAYPQVQRLHKAGPFCGAAQGQGCCGPVLPIHMHSTALLDNTAVNNATASPFLTCPLSNHHRVPRSAIVGWESGELPLGSG
jgi:hypothetical protein